MQTIAVTMAYDGRGCQPPSPGRGPKTVGPTAAGRRTGPVPRRTHRTGTPGPGGPSTGRQVSELTTEFGAAPRVLPVRPNSNLGSQVEYDLAGTRHPRPPSAVPAHPLRWHDPLVGQEVERRSHLGRDAGLKIPPRRALRALPLGRRRGRPLLHRRIADMDLIHRVDPSSAAPAVGVRQYPAVLPKS